MTGYVIAVLAIALALGFGLWRRTSDGRVRTSTPVSAAAAASQPARSPLTGTEWADQLGERATLVQFSSAFCAPCRTTRVVLGDVAATTDGVRHVEIDAEEQLDLVRQLKILRTPTTLILDGTGAEVGRATGAARKQDVLAALDSLGYPK